MAFERVHHIHGSDRLAAGVLSVGDGITDDILQDILDLLDRERSALALHIELRIHQERLRLHMRGPRRTS